MRAAISKRQAGVSAEMLLWHRERLSSWRGPAPISAAILAKLISKHQRAPYAWSMKSDPRRGSCIAYARSSYDNRPSISRFGHAHNNNQKRRSGPPMQALKRGGIAWRNSPRGCHAGAASALFAPAGRGRKSSVAMWPPAHSRL